MSKNDDAIKLMLQLKTEISELERKIKHSGLENLKIGLVKNLKISSRAMQFVAPYVLSAGLFAGVFKVVGIGFPFCKNDYIYNSHMMKEYDNFGHIRTEQQYQKFDHEDSVLSYYSKWTKNENGIYERYVQRYHLNHVTEEDVIKLFSGEITVSDTLGEPFLNFIETNNHVTEEEFERGAFVQATVYDVNKDDYVVVHEFNENIFSLYVFLTIVIEVMLYWVISPKSRRKFSNCIDQIKMQYQPIDVPKLVKELELKKSNYNQIKL